MAKQPDILGLFTGISNKPIDPTGMTESQQRSALQNRGLLRAREDIVNALGKQTAGQKQQTQRADYLANFDNLSVEEQKKAVYQLQAAGQTGLAGQLASRVKAKADEAKLTEDALLVADSLPPEYSQLAEAIRRGIKGSLAKGIEILGRKKTEVKQPKGEKPTATDITSAKKALSLAGEEAKGGEAFGFLGTDWNDAWNNQTEAAKDLLATQVAEVTNKLIKPPASLDLSEARKLAIQKMYTDNLTETGLFEWGKGESRMMNPDEIVEKQKKDLEARLNKY